MIVNLLSCRSHDFTTHHLVKSYLQASRWQTIPQGSVSVPGVGGARTWFSCEVGNLQEAHACFKTITAFPRPGFFESWFWTRVKRLTFFINDAMTHTRRRCDAPTWQSDKIGFRNGARYWLLTIDRDGTVVAASQINEKHRSANKTRRVSFEIEVRGQQETRARTRHLKEHWGCEKAKHCGVSMYGRDVFDAWQ